MVTRAPHVESLSAWLGRRVGRAEVVVERFTVTAWCLPSDSAARRARQLLRHHLDGRITDESVLDDLEIMACELATNATIHAGGPCEMRILHHGGTPVVCEIADTGGGLDGIAEHLRRHAGLAGSEDVVHVEALQVGGRGLGIVARLSGGRCGTHPTRLGSTGQTGKSVWFAIPQRSNPSLSTSREGSRA